MSRSKAFFINGGAGRVICSIPALEKYEQELVNKYILENDVVLELGARYGSVSCIINYKFWFYIIYNNANFIIII